MKTEVYKCLGHFMLRIIVLLFWSCKGLAQSSLSSTTPFKLSPETSSSSSVSDKSTSSWTFTGKGYIAVYPLKLSNQNPDYKLSFRTKNRYGTLFCHILKDLKQLKDSKLENYEFCAELHEGSLRISYHINNLVETVLVGKGELMENFPKNLCQKDILSNSFIIKLLIVTTVLGWSSFTITG